MITAAFLYLLLDLEHAAVKRDNFARQEGCPSVGEKDCQFRHLLRLPEAHKRDFICQCLPFVLAEAGIHFRINDTAGDGIDPNMGGPSSFAIALVKALMPPLEADTQPHRMRRPRPHGGNIENDTILFGYHGRDGKMGAVQHRTKVDHPANGSIQQGSYP